MTGRRANKTTGHNVFCRFGLRADDSKSKLEVCFRCRASEEAPAVVSF